MSDRVRALLGLVAALLLVRGGLWLAGREPAEVGRALLAFDPAAVARVRLSHGAEALVLERTDGGWRLASHGDLPAREGAVEALLARLREWRVERVAGDDPAHHEEWFLTEARARRIVLEAEGGAQLAEVWVGKVTGIDPDAPKTGETDLDVADLGLVVRARSGPGELPDRALVVSAFVTRQLDPEPRTWLPHPLVGGTADEVSRLAFAPPGAPAFAFELTPPRFVEPSPVAPAPLDPLAARALVQRLYLLEALGPAPGGEPPASAVRVEVARADALDVLRLWEQDGAWLLERGDGLRVRVRSAAAAALASARAATLVRERLFLIAASDVREVHWSGEGFALALTKSERGWQVEGAGGRVVLSAERGLALARRLAELEAAGWQASDGVPPATERLRVVTRGGIEHVAELGPGPQGATAARLAGVEGVALLDREAVAALRAALHDPAGE